jgi:hypothetical protein
MLIAFLWKELVIVMQVELIVEVEQAMTFKRVGWRIPLFHGFKLQFLHRGWARPLRSKFNSQEVGCL